MALVHAIPMDANGDDPRVTALCGFRAGWGARLPLRTFARGTGTGPYVATPEGRDQWESKSCPTCREMAPRAYKLHLLKSELGPAPEWLKRWPRG